LFQRFHFFKCPGFEFRKLLQCAFTLRI
jgi:hypothetical protein